MLKIELIPFAFDGRVPTPNQGCNQDGSNLNSRFSRAGITRSINQSLCRDSVSLNLSGSKKKAL